MDGFRSEESDSRQPSRRNFGRTFLKFMKVPLECGESGAWERAPRL